MAKNRPNKRQRTMYYLRSPRDLRVDPLEDELDVAHGLRPTTADRTFRYGDEGGEIVGLSWIRKTVPSLGRLALGHVAYYVPRESASMVPTPSKVVPQSDTTLRPPPRRADYLRGDLMYMVARNHVVVCPNEVRAPLLNFYFWKMLQHAGLFGEHSAALEPIADADKVDLLDKEGVKSIQLGASLYDASLDHISRRPSDRVTIRQKLTGELSTLIAAFFTADENLAQIEEDANLMVRVEMSFDSRRKGGELGRERIDKLASQILEEEEGDGGEGDFRIITGSGQRIRPGELKLSRPATVEPKGRSVDRDDVWSRLTDFYEDLKDTGALEE